MAKNSKIIRYKKPMNINIGMIIFAVIFIYLSFSVYTYISRDKIKFYEVVEGSIVNDKVYTGIIFRDETIKKTEKTGYINYYIREGKKASVGAKVYSIDETGQMKTFLEEQQGSEVTVSEDTIYNIKKQLTSACLNYNDNAFYKIYDEKYSLQSIVSDNMQFNSLDNIDAVLKEKGINYEQVHSDRSGIISYAMDSLDGLQPSDITESSFDKSGYTKTMNKAGVPIEGGTPVYKVITSEDWSVVFQISDEDKALYDGKEKIKIKINNGNLTFSGRYSLITGADGKSYGKLDFDKYMVQFASSRFLDFEIITEEAEGLKIPVSSVVSKEFYTVPTEYLTQGGDGSDSGFYKEVYSETGEASIVFTPSSIYGSTDGIYYVDKSEKGEFKSGDYIVKPDSSERYQVGPVASLNGVYNINKGYAVFRIIKEIANNGEYYTIETGSKYGLSVYDHIVLDSSTVTEGQIIYQ